MAQVYITSLELWNIKVFEHFHAKLGRLTVAAGTNGSGKSSLALAVSMFFEPGGDPSLIRRGCDEGKGIVTLSNGYSITKIQKRDGYEVIVKNPEGGTCAAPASIISKMLPRHSFRAEEFLDDMDIQKRTDFILEHLPVVFSIEHINEALSVKFGALTGEPPVPLLPEKGPDKSLEEFDKIFKEVDTARAAINRSIENLKGACLLLQDSLPSDDSTNWSAEVDRLHGELSAVDTAIATAESQTKLEAEKARTEKSTWFHGQIIAAVKSAETYLGAAKSLWGQMEAIYSAAAVTEDACDALLKRADIDVADFIKSTKDMKRLNIELIDIQHKITKAESDAIAEIRSDKGEQRVKLSGDLGEAKQKAQEQERGKGVQDALAKSRAELKGENVRYEHISAVMDALRKLKAQKMRAVDIPGFDISWIKEKNARKESAVILIDGLPLDQLNRQQALFIALKLVVLAQKANPSDEQLPLVIMETAELVESKRQELRDAVERAGLQLVITVPVDGQPLTVEALA